MDFRDVCSFISEVYNFRKLNKLKNMTLTERQDTPFLRTTHKRKEIVISSPGGFGMASPKCILSSGAIKEAKK